MKIYLVIFKGYFLMLNIWLYVEIESIKLELYFIDVEKLVLC